MKKCDRITISITAHEEHETPEESERTTGSAPGYAEAVREVASKATGIWGWCVAVVEATAWDVDEKVGEGRATLGNCSYLSADDFATNSGYMPQMVEEAIKEALQDDS
jgi:hypothetical protein